MKYLGVDFGLKRVGLATSEGDLASPWKIIEGSSYKDLLEKLKICAEGFDKLIVGLPEGEMGKKVEKLVKDLQASGFDVEITDETLSSQNATAMMVELNISKEKRSKNDAHSAAIILQNYLDSR